MVTKFTGVPFYYVGESYWDLCPAGIWQGEKKKKKKKRKRKEFHFKKNQKLFKKKKKKKKKKERHCYIS